MIHLSKLIISEEAKAKVRDILDSGMLANGTYTSQFEKKFSRYCGRLYGVATSSGTTALHVALLALGIGPGDKVLTTPFSFIASSNAILYCGARPVFCDIDPQTFNIDPAQIRKALKKDKDIKALLVVHLYGLPCSLEEIVEIAKEFGLKLIEDCAQAAGAEFQDKKVGSFGDVGCFSFYATKNMTTGEGGMVLTDDDDLARRCRSLINHGRTARSSHNVLGYNYRMTDIAAALGLCQLEKLDEFNAKRIDNAHYLTENLRELDWIDTPVIPLGCKHVFHQYTVRVRSRDKFVERLAAGGVESAIFYPLPIPQQPFYPDLGYGGGSYPEARRASLEVASLPVHPALSKADLAKIVEVVKSFGGFYEDC